METNIYTKLFEVKKAWIKLQRDTKAFNYKYATLSQIQEKLSDAIEKQWLLIYHYVKDNYVVTEIREWKSNTFVQSSIPMSEWTKPQDKWSEITYYRRYNLLSLLDLEVEDDDWKKAQDSSTSKEYKGKFDLMDYIQRIKDETDINALDSLYKEFMKEKPTQKQIDWFVKDAGARKDYLVDNQ